MRTLNPELNKKDILINSVMGLCGESGEAIDIVKKWLMQGHDLDKNHLIKELGDIAWYLAEAATALDVPLDTILGVILINYIKDILMDLIQVLLSTDKKRIDSASQSQSSLFSYIE